MVTDGGGKIFPQVIIDRLAGEFSCGLFEFGPENLVRFVPAREPHDADGRGEGAVGGEIVECGNEFAVSEVARGTEDHECAGVWNGSLGKAFPKRIGAQSIKWHFACLSIRREWGVQSVKTLHSFSIAISGNLHW